MIKLYSAESFRDYLDNPGPPDWVGNGDAILLPTKCEISAEASSGAWQLTLTHPYDEEGRYKYIQKGCVVAVEAPICREQVSRTQFYRIKSVKLTLNEIEAIGFPVAMDAINECPIQKKTFELMDIRSMINELKEDGLIPQKYDVDLEFTDQICSIYAENTNLQEFINGDQDASIRSMFGTEVVYDNYTYRIYPRIGAGEEYAALYPVKYRYNLKGFDISEDMSEVITRIYPISGDGYSRVEVKEIDDGGIDILPTNGEEVYGEVDDDEEVEFHPYIDADWTEEYSDIMHSYPIVYARVIQYDDVKMIDEKSDDDYTPPTEGQNVTRNVKEEIIAKVNELSLKYLKKARNGEWNHETGMVTGYWYGTKNEDDTAHNYPKDQYLVINGTWYHFDKDGYYRSGDIIDTETKRYLDQFSWREDDTGWFYTDGNENYFYNCWITSKDGTTHYWVGSDGYLDDEYTDTETWQWFTETGHTYRNPHAPDIMYDETDDRYCLPYGYLFYSYTDAIGVLTEKALSFVSKDQQAEVYNFFADAIQRGFKYLETSENYDWDWRAKFIYEGEDAMYLDNFRWLQDSTGWWYGDGQGHYFTNAWVEDRYENADGTFRVTHSWVGADGYYQPQWDDQTPWEWYQDRTGWWYGSKFEDGTTKNFAIQQFIFDTASRNWCKFNPNGYFVEPDRKKWWYGTKDGSDYVFFKFWIIEDHIYWFDFDGYVSDEITYIDKYEWRTDGNGTYYGDGKGHYVKNAWVEESTSKHYWLDENGYVDDTKTDTSEWSWTGSWDEGWKYGSSDPQTEYDETEATGTNYTSTQQCLIDIDDVCDNMEDYTKDTLITKIQSLISGKSYASGSTLDKIMTYLSRAAEDAGITKSGMVTYILNLITDSGFDLTGVGDNNETNSATNAASGKSGKTQDTTSNDEEDDSGDDSGDDEGGDDPTELENYAKDQMLYITGNNTVYYFNSDGYMVGAWMADNNWEWLSDSKGWWYGDNEGTYPTGQWMKISGKWYFFNTNGYADQSTDDFADNSKTGGDNSPSFDSNREGISVSSDTSATSSDTSYDENREGVKAWITDDFISELKEFLQNELNELQKSLNDRLEAVAKSDLENYMTPTYTAEIDFEQLAGVQGFEQYEYLMHNYLGDYVETIGPGYSWAVKQRIEGLTYDCLSKRVINITIGSPCNMLVRQFLKLNDKGRLVTYMPNDSIETGYSEYDGELEGDITEFLGTGYSGNIDASIQVIPDTDE